MMKILLLTAFLGAASAVKCPGDCPATEWACPAKSKAVANGNCNAEQCNAGDFGAKSDCCALDMSYCSNNVASAAKCTGDFVFNTAGKCTGDCTEAKDFGGKVTTCCMAKPAEQQACAAATTACTDGKVTNPTGVCAGKTCTADELKGLCCVTQMACSAGKWYEADKYKCGVKQPAVAMTCSAGMMIDTTKKCASNVCNNADLLTCCVANKKYCSNFGAGTCSDGFQRKAGATCAKDCAATDFGDATKACCEAKPAQKCSAVLGGCTDAAKATKAAGVCKTFKCTADELKGATCCADKATCTLTGVTQGDGVDACGKAKTKPAACAAKSKIDTTKKCAGETCTAADLLVTCCAPDKSYCANNGALADKCTGDFEFNAEGKCTGDCTEAKDFGGKVTTCCKAKQQSCALATCGEGKVTDTSKVCAGKTCTADELKGLCCKATPKASCAAVTCPAGTHVASATATCAGTKCVADDAKVGKCCANDETCAAGILRHHADVVKDAMSTASTASGAALAALATFAAVALHM